MDTTRQNKIARLLQKELGTYFQRTSQAFAPGILVSVTDVRVTPDLSLAKVYLSIFPQKKRDDVFIAIKEQAKQIKFEMGKAVRHQLRKIPELSFYIDDSLDMAERIDELLK